MKRLALAITLACVLLGIARAGEMHPTGAVATPTPTPGTVTTTGDIPTNGATATEPSSTLLTIILTINSLVR